MPDLMTLINTPAPAAYPVGQPLNADTLTAPVSPAADSARPLPFPEGATKEQVLDAVVLLEPHLRSPAVNALCAVALSWYLDTLSQADVVNLSERVQLLIQRTAYDYPHAFARA